MAPATSRKLRPRKKSVMAPATSRELRPRKKAVATAVLPTTTRKKRVAQASNIQPASDHNNYVESGSDHDNVNEPGSDDDNNVESVSRDILVVEAKLIAVKVKQLTQNVLKELETLLRRKGMSGDGGPYKDAMQKLKKGKKIDDEVGTRIGRYIYLWLSGFRAFLSTLIRVKDWDDEIVGEIIKFIKRELNEHLEVEVQEVQELLKIAEDVRSESDETRKLVKGERLKNRVLNWVMNTEYLFETSNDWGKKPTPSFRSFDEDYMDDDQASPSGSDDDNNVESGSDDDNNVESVSRDTRVVEAKLIAEKVKLLTQKALKELETFLRRKGMSGDGGPYKDAIQKLKKGKKIDDKVGARIAKYIYLLLRGFRAFAFALIRVKDWDDEIVGEIIKFIKRELNEHLEVEVPEVQELLKIAEDVRSESDETWKPMKGKRLKNRVVNWVMNTKYLEKTSNDWGKKPTPSFKSFDEDYIDYDQAFPSGQGLFMR